MYWKKKFIKDAPDIRPDNQSFFIVFPLPDVLQTSQMLLPLDLQTIKYISMNRKHLQLAELGTGIKNDNKTVQVNWKEILIDIQKDFFLLSIVEKSKLKQLRYFRQKFVGYRYRI